MHVPPPASAGEAHCRRRPPRPGLGRRAAGDRRGDRRARHGAAPRRPQPAHRARRRRRATTARRSGPARRPRGAGRRVAEIDHAPYRVEVEPARDRAAQRGQPGAGRVRLQALRRRRRPRRGDVRLRHPQPERGAGAARAPGRSRACRRGGLSLFPTGGGDLCALEPRRARGAGRHLVRVRRRRGDRSPEAVRRRARGLAGARRRRRAAGEDVCGRAARRARARARRRSRSTRRPPTPTSRSRPREPTRRSRPARRSVVARGLAGAPAAGRHPAHASAARRCSTSSAALVETDRAAAARGRRRHVVHGALPARAAVRRVRRGVASRGRRARAAAGAAPRRGGVRVRVARGAPRELHRRPRRAARRADGARRGRGRASALPSCRPRAGRPRCPPASSAR